MHKKWILKHQATLIKLALRLEYTKEDAEDLVNDTFIRAWKKRKLFTKGSNLRAWLCRIMTNLHNTRVSTLLKRDKHLRGYTNMVSSRLAKEIPNVSRERLGECARILLTSKPKHLCRLAWLVWVDGLNYKQVARKLRIPIGTIMSRLYRLRQRLKKELQDAR